MGTGASLPKNRLVLQDRANEITGKDGQPLLEFTGDTAKILAKSWKWKHSKLFNKWVDYQLKRNKDEEAKKANTISKEKCLQAIVQLQKNARHFDIRKQYVRPASNSTKGAKSPAVLDRYYQNMQRSTIKRNPSFKSNGDELRSLYRPHGKLKKGERPQSGLSYFMERSTEARKIAFDKEEGLTFKPDLSQSLNPKYSQTPKWSPPDPWVFEFTLPQKGRVSYHSLPASWICPGCGVPKSAFEPLQTDVGEDGDEEKRWVHPRTPHNIKAHRRWRKYKLYEQKKQARMRQLKEVQFERGNFSFTPTFATKIAKTPVDLRPQDRCPACKRAPPLVRHRDRERSLIDDPELCCSKASGRRDTKTNARAETCLFQCVLSQSNTTEPTVFQRLFTSRRNTFLSGHTRALDIDNMCAYCRQQKKNCIAVWKSKPKTFARKMSKVIPFAGGMPQVWLDDDHSPHEGVWLTLVMRWVYPIALRVRDVARMAEEEDGLLIAKGVGCPSRPDSDTADAAKATAPDADSPADKTSNLGRSPTLYPDSPASLRSALQRVCDCVERIQNWSRDAANDWSRFEDTEEEEDSPHARFMYLLQKCIEYLRSLDRLLDRARSKLMRYKFAVLREAERNLDQLPRLDPNEGPSPLRKQLLSEVVDVLVVHQRGSFAQGILPKTDFWSLTEEGNAGFEPALVSGRAIEEARVPADLFHYNMCALRLAQRTMRELDEPELFWNDPAEAATSFWAHHRDTHRTVGCQAVTRKIYPRPAARRPSSSSGGGGDRPGSGGGDSQTPSQHEWERIQQQNRMLRTLHTRRVKAKKTFRRLLREAKEKKLNAPPTTTLGAKKKSTSRTSRYGGSGAHYATTAQDPPRPTPLQQAVSMVGELDLKDWLQFLLHAPSALWDHEVFDGLLNDEKSKLIKLQKLQELANTVGVSESEWAGVSE